MPRSRRPKPVRTVGRNWKVYDKEPGAVREVRRWDAVLLAVIDGGITPQPVDLTGASETDETAAEPARRRRTRRRRAA